MKRPLNLTYTTEKRVIIPLKKLTEEELKYLKLWETNEDEYSDSDWDFMEKHNFNEIIERFIPDEDFENLQDIEVYDYSLK